jgi:hypothetical protein
MAVPDPVEPGSDSSRRPAPRSEVLIALPATFEPVVRARSTLVNTSLLALSEEGLAPAYWARLPERHHQGMASLVPGGWAPIELVAAHYGACQALGLGHAQMDALFKRTHERVSGTILGTVCALAKAAGASPWLAIKRYAGAWDRLFVGGGVGVWKLGPKEARLEARGLAILDIPYFARSVRGLHQRALDLFSTRAFVHPLAAAPGALAYHVSWV